MKYIVTIFLLIISTTSFSQNIYTEIIGDWLGVKTESNNSNSYHDFNGYLLEFKADSLSFGHIFSDSLTSSTYTISDSSIMLGDSTIIQIQYISVDSIKLIFNEVSLATFIQIPFTNPAHIEIRNDELIGNSWIYLDSGYQQRMEFSNYKWTHHDDATYEFYTHPSNDSVTYNTYSNRWRIFQHKANTYFLRTWMLHFGILHEITKLTDDTIYTKAWIGNSFRYPMIIKIKAASDSILREVSYYLQSKTWSIQKVDYNYEPSRKKWQEAVSESVEQTAIEKNMRFQFKADSLTIFNNDSTFLKGKWKLTRDAKYIILDSAPFGFHCEIIELGSEKLILRNSPAFTYLMNLMNIKEIDFKFTLE